MRNEDFPKSIVGTPTAAFSWRDATPAQRRVVMAAGLGWMLDAFDVMLYSIVLATLMRSEISSTQNRATALGISYNVARGLSALAPLTIGALSERHGLAWAFGASAIAFAAATFVALLLPETRGVELR